MNKHPIQIVCEALEIDTRSYSGRGMYGKECLAVTTGLTVSHLFADIVDAIIGEDALKSADFSIDGEDPEREEVLHDVTKAFRRVSQDNMGTGYVYYFQGIDFVEGDDEEEEDEDSDDE